MNQRISSNNFYNKYNQRKSINPDESLDLYASPNESMISQTPRMNFDPNQSQMNSFTLSPIRNPGQNYNQMGRQSWNNNPDDSINENMFNGPNGPQFDPRFSNNSNMRLSNQRMSNNQRLSNFNPNQPNQTRLTNYNPKRTDFPPNSNNYPSNGYTAESTQRASQGPQFQEQQWKKVNNQPFEIIDLMSQESQRRGGFEREQGGFVNYKHEGYQEHLDNQDFMKKTENGYVNNQGQTGGRMQNYAELNNGDPGALCGRGLPMKGEGGGYCGKEECVLI